MVEEIPVSLIPKQRLNEIAQRKLELLGVPTRLGNDGQTVWGRLTHGGNRLRHPATGQVITTVDFVVEGHDRLLLINPTTFRRLGPIPFHEFDQVAVLFERIADLTDFRMNYLESMRLALTTFGICCSVDREQQTVVGKVELTGFGTILLEGDYRGLYTKQFAPCGGNCLAMEAFSVVLEEYDSLTDLEIALSHLAEQAFRCGAPAAVEPCAQTVQPASLHLEPMPQAADTVTLGMLVDKLGPDFLVGWGAQFGLEYRLGEHAVCLEMQHRSRQNFSGRLSSNGQVLWEDSFDIVDFPGAASLVASVTGLQVVPSAEEQPEVLRAQARHPVQILPVPQEVWCMNIIITEDSGNEVRYVTIDSEGNPFGAVRVMPNSVFFGLFVETEFAGFRLNVLVIGVANNAVEYYHIDANRQTMGEQRSMDLTAFVATFTPEAALY